MSCHSRTPQLSSFLESQGGILPAAPREKVETFLNRPQSLPLHQPAKFQATLAFLLQQFRYQPQENLALLSPQGEIVDLIPGQTDHVRRCPQNPPHLISLHNHPLVQGVGIAPSQEDFREALQWQDLAFYVVLPQGYYQIDFSPTNRQNSPGQNNLLFNRFWQAREEYCRRAVQQRPAFYPHTANFELDFWVSDPQLRRRVAFLYNQSLLVTAAQNQELLTIVYRTLPEEVSP